MTKQPTIFMLGAGSMGGAVATAIRRSGIDAQNVHVMNSRPESTERAAKEYDLTPADSLEDAVREADIIILGIKPYQLAAQLPKLAEHLSADTLVVSLAAGATIDTLREHLGGHEKIIRTMPNTPVAVGSGVVAVMPADAVTDEETATVEELFAASADVVRVPEDKVHQVIGAAGSAPAFMFYVAEAMIDEGVMQGLTRDQAAEMVIATMAGSAKLLQEQGLSPAEARYRVSSPGGTTVRGVAALEEAGVRVGLAKAMRAAADWSRHMEEG
ncbi:MULTISPECIES: pyrroline-5-carboxylate reductase [Helcobacillus]|uniref:Pyrroline-5-carboxylate reductase n=1 Tax=Helcobacillus massiliensis TaxID=521392 RepID=A0A839QRB8_9MICO|nr:pyrroline-5-carboxylate reductase [Helcobacillus massiliensis]MCG7427967.1 pyrroline-5-carboxylate reductase [Helcobacillus sp. ACRRO]